MQTIQLHDLANVTGGCQSQQTPQPSADPAASGAASQQGAAASEGGGAGVLQQLLGFLQSPGFQQLLGSLQGLLGQGGQSSASQPAAASAPTA